MTACEGLYADVSREKEITNVGKDKKFINTLNNYENYKRGFNKDIVFPSIIESMFFIFFTKVKLSVKDIR